MDEETLGRLRGICAAYPQPAQRAPDREEFITRVMAVRRGAGVAYEDNFFWASAACCIYGTPGVSPNPARVREVRQYLIRWRDRSDGVCLQEEQLLPLGFCCALRVNPDPHEPGPPGDPWPGAVGVLLAQLAGFAGGLIGGLHTVGFHNADLLDSFQSGGGGQVIAAHTLGVIMGHTRCMCGPTFYAAVGAGHGGRQAHHHACQHILPSWVNPEYPAAFLEAHPPDPPEPGGIDGDDTAWLPFSAFVYRAVCGPCGSPTRPRALRYAGDSQRHPVHRLRGAPSRLGRLPRVPGPVASQHAHRLARQRGRLLLRPRGREALQGVRPAGSALGDVVPVRLRQLLRPADELLLSPERAPPARPG
jgi:hypothetical protein